MEKENKTEEVQPVEEQKPEVEQPVVQPQQPKKKSKALLWIILIVVLLAGLGVGGYFYFTKDKTKDNKNEVVVELNPLLTELKMTGNGLEDFDLYFLKLNNDGKNKIYSPLSIKYALEMLSEGAKGETKAQIDEILGSYKAGKYSNSKNMSFANALFVKQELKNDINSEYTQNLKDKFNAEIIYDSFNSASNINNWISDKTLDLINNVLSDEDVEDKLFIIINALGIDMEWINRIQRISDENTDYSGFSVSFPNEAYNYYINVYVGNESHEEIEFDGKTTEALQYGSVFNNYDIVKELGEENIRKTVTDAYKKHEEEVEGNPDCLIPNFDEYLDNYVSTLNENYHEYKHSTDYNYYKDENIQVFSKDLKKYGSTQLQYIQIMPINQKLDDYIKDIKASDLNTLISKVKTPQNADYKEGSIIEINGYVTPFKMEYNLDLIKNLNALGIYNIFNQDKADLTGIIPKGAYITQAQHAANIEFTNDGIKAAAVTVVGGAGDADCSFYYSFDVPVEKIDLTFDKPYMYLIVDKNTSEVWFAGTTYTIDTPKTTGGDYDF